MFDFLQNFPEWKYILSVFIGVGLASAAGFRVFLPIFIVSLASYMHWLPLGDSFSWLGGLPALVIAGVATLVEIFAYFIPFIDHLLDTLAIPVATAAGILLFASQFVDTGTFLQWALAVIAGGGTAATISSAFAGARLASTSTTGGIGNSLVATTETVGSMIFSVLAIVLPAIVFILSVILLFLIFKFGKKIFRKFFEKKQNI